MPLFKHAVAAAQPTVQARRTTAFTLGAAFADVNLDATDVQNYTPVVEHTSADQITVKVAGEYEVAYGCTAPAGTQTTSLRVRKNDASVIDGSEAASTAAGDAENIARQFVASLVAGDYITLQAMSSAGTPDIAAGLTLTISHLAGQKGDPGSPSATDVDAVHVNVGNEISTIAEKMATDSDDLLIIEDSAAAGVKKKLKVGNLPGGASPSDVAPLDVDTTAADPGVGADFSRYDHKHDAKTATTAAGAVAVGNAAAEGAGDELARAKHQHAVARGTPVSVGTANAAGSGASFVGDDHVHAGLTRDANDFAVFAGKATPVAADLLLIEDSGAAGVKKKIMVGDLPADSTALHKATAAEISAMAEKVTPASADVLVLEDSAAGYAKRKVQVGNLSSVFGASYQYAASEAVSTSALVAWTTKATLTTPALTGTFRVAYHCELANNGVNKTHDCRLYNATDAVELCSDSRQRPKANLYGAVDGFVQVIFTGAAKTFQSQWASPDGSTVVSIRRARIELWRVA